MAGPVSTVVVDANLMMALAAELPYSEHATALMDAWQRDHVRLCAPLLWEYELVTAVRKALALGLFLEQEATAALEHLWSLGVERIAPDRELHHRSLGWAARLGQVVAYDAQYLALAERLGAELWTADRRLARQAAVSGLDWVHPVGQGEVP